jgi:hypothetical protein
MSHAAIAACSPGWGRSSAGAGADRVDSFGCKVQHPVTRSDELLRQRVAETDRVLEAQVR